jgi:hypothetical protein
MQNGPFFDAANPEHPAMTTFMQKGSHVIQPIYTPPVPFFQPAETDGSCASACLLAMLLDIFKLLQFGSTLKDP